MKHAPFDILGNIALVKFQKGVSSKTKKEFANELLRSQKSIKTVLEKVGKFAGRLRKQTTKYVAGVNTKEALYHENGCIFRFNVDSCYFSSRLSNERKEIAKMVKSGDEVLVMFAGVAPYSIVIAKNTKAKKVYSNEINREASKYAELNIGLNKVKDKVVLLNGDIKRVTKKLIYSSHPTRDFARVINVKNLSLPRNRSPTQKKAVNARKNFISSSILNIPKKFDVIVMPRPQLKETFLGEAFLLSKKGTRIFYYDFCKENEIQKVLGKIKLQAAISKKKIKILKVKKAGEIAPYKYRIRVDFVVL